MSDMMKRLANLPEEQRARFLAQLRAQVEGVTTRGPSPRRDTGPAPLSYAQESLWFLDKLAPSTSVYNVPLFNRLRGNLDVGALRTALAGVVARHEALRTAIVDRDDGAVQVIADSVPVELPVIDVPGDDTDARLKAAEELLDKETATPIELGKLPLWRAYLLRIDPDDYYLAFNVHHIVFDGWSQAMFDAELAALYTSAVTGAPPQLPELTIQYPDYSSWQREWLADRLDELGNYWRDQLKGMTTMEFPTDRPRPASVTFNGSLVSTPITERLKTRVRELAREEAVTPYTVYVAAFFALLQRCSGAEDIVIGAPNASRQYPSVETVIGFFISMMVLRADLSGNPTFRELIQRLKPVMADSISHADLPFGKLVDAVSPPRDPSRLPIFQTTFVLNAAESPIALPGVSVTYRRPHGISARMEMSWIVAERPGAGATLAVEYNTDLFDADTMNGHLRHYLELLGNLTAAPDALVGEAEMLTETERAWLLTAGSGLDRAVRETTVTAQFEARARELPGQAAIVAADEALTFAELNRRANQLAALLRDRGATAGSIVGLCLRRSSDLVVAMLAALKSGAAYLPLDPSHPPARVAGIVADAEPVAVLAHAGTAAALADANVPVLVLDDLRGELADQPAGDPPPASEPGDISYVIYTSGTTGQPKGVLTAHRSLVNFTDSIRDLFEVTPQDRILGFASATFDVSLFEIFAALLNGACVRLLGEDERLSIERLQAVLENEGITITDIPPAVMTLLSPERLSDLRIAFVGCEAFSGELVNRWNKGRRLFNGYGPTECTVTMITEECPGTWDAEPPIGLPMANHVAHVLDDRLRLLPPGMPGELVIGGAGLAVGYLGSPELNDRKFVADPFGTSYDGRLYRTGDLVTRLPDGRLVFLGRVDQQVKIRGLRIELGDVESALASFPGIGQVSVRDWTDSGGERYLAGYVTPGPGSSEAPDTQAIRDHLADRLPSYMIPAHFVVLGELPLNSSGKTDKARLPEPDASVAPVSADGEPRTETERIVLQEVLIPLLRNQGMGIYDDFFSAGGNSLQAAQLMSALNRRFGVAISLADFFTSPTAAHLASVADSLRTAQLSDDQLLDLLEKMPEGPASSRPADRRPFPNLQAKGIGVAADHPPVPLQPGPGPTRLVLLHPSGGALFCYTPLVRALQPEIDVIGYAADPADRDLPDRERMATVASRLLTSLARVADPGRCLLAGWSHGGVLAFEMARQHAMAGQTPPHAVLIDCCYWGDRPPEDEPTLRRRFVYDLIRVNGGDKAVAESAAAGAHSLDWAGLRGALGAAGISLILTDEELADRYETFRRCCLGMQSYNRPATTYDGKVTLLVTQQADLIQQRWAAVVTGPMRTVRLPGDHFTLFQPPALATVASEIEAAAGLRQLKEEANGLRSD
jgi:amino acid adenylation domain-containing protein